MTGLGIHKVPITGARHAQAPITGARHAQVPMTGVRHAQAPMTGTRSVQTPPCGTFTEPLEEKALQIGTWTEQRQASSQPVQFGRRNILLLYV